MSACSLASYLHYCMTPLLPLTPLLLRVFIPSFLPPTQGPSGTYHYTPPHAVKSNTTLTIVDAITIVPRIIVIPLLDDQSNPFTLPLQVCCDVRKLSHFPSYVISRHCAFFLHSQQTTFFNPVFLSFFSHVTLCTSLLSLSFRHLAAQGRSIGVFATRL
jgi:hypothetical protein